MKRIVLDSSVIVKLLSAYNELYVEVAEQILDDCKEGKIKIYTTELSRYEIGNAILNKKEFSLKNISTFISTLYYLPIDFIPEDKNLASDTYQIANNYSLTYYDASFLSLAKQSNCPLITDNIKHQGKVKGIEVVALKDYSS